MTEITASGWEQHAEACRRRLAQGDSAGAEKCFASALAEAEALGPDSAGLAGCLTVLGQIRTQQRDHRAAETLFRRALEVREQAAEFDHTGIIQILGHLAAVHNARADYDEADALLTRALALADKYFPPSHPAVASLLNNLARLYFKRADHAKADRMLVRLLQIKQALGTEHPEVAGVLASIAALRSALGKHDVAEQLWRRVLAIREKSLPHNDPAIIATLNSLADACASQGEHEEALHFRERGVRLQAQLGGSGQGGAAAQVATQTPERDSTPVQPQPSVPEPRRAPAPTPVAREITPIALPAPVRFPTPLPLEIIAPPSPQPSRITPIPLAPMVPAVGSAIGAPATRPSGEFPPPVSIPDQVIAARGIGGPVPTPSAPAVGIGGPLLTPSGAAAGIGGPVPTPSGAAIGIGGPPLGLTGSIDGVGAPPASPRKLTPVRPDRTPPTFGGFEPPAPAPAPVFAAPLPPAPASAAPRKRVEPPAPPPREPRPERSAERPRYEGYDNAPVAPRRGSVVKVLAGLAVAAGLGFAALTLVKGRNLAPAEAVADTVASEPRIIRIPAESLKVGRQDSKKPGPTPTITLDSALAASRARNALDTPAAIAVPGDSTTRRTADSTARPIVVPGPRTLEALSRAVDAGLKTGLDSALRAPAPKTPGLKTP